MDGFLGSRRMIVSHLGSTSTQVISIMARKTLKRSNEINGHAVESMPEVSEQAIRELAQVFKLLSDETRLRILFYLAQNNELHVTDLCQRLGQSQPAVSHHLALLRHGRLIEPRRSGKHNFYGLTDGGRELAKVVQSIID
jgi:ArsR family transcriptional regulator